MVHDNERFFKGVVLNFETLGVRGEWLFEFGVSVLYFEREWGCFVDDALTSIQSKFFSVPFTYSINVRT